MCARCQAWLLRYSNLASSLQSSRSAPVSESGYLATGENGQGAKEARKMSPAVANERFGKHRRTVPLAASWIASNGNNAHRLRLLEDALQESAVQRLRNSTHTQT